MPTVLTPTAPRPPVIRDLRQRVADAERAYNNLSADRRSLFAQLLRERQQREQAEEQARTWEQRARQAGWTDDLPAIDPT